MQIKTYIIIVIFLIVVILTVYVEIFTLNKTILESKKNIVKPDISGIDNLEIKQLKNIVSEQEQILNKQTDLIKKYIDKKEKTFNESIRKPEEHVDKYFENIRKENDKKIKYHHEDDGYKDMTKKFKIQVVKRYLEDPVTRGFNIYESEQYSKLLDIGNISVKNRIPLPHPTNWSININN